jgi:prefoldin subunit 5
MGNGEAAAVAHLKLKAKLAEAERRLAVASKNLGELGCRIVTRCPSCNGQFLFIGTGGHLTCSSLDCKEPSVGSAVEQLKAERDDLARRLPEGMKDCTIRFLKCEKGHGRLTADNWVDHGCYVCQLADAERRATGGQGVAQHYRKYCEEVESFSQEIQAKLAEAERRADTWEAEEKITAGLLKDAEQRAENAHKLMRRHRRPTHGPCCTCQVCGLGHDECRCDLDDAIERTEKLERERDDFQAGMGDLAKAMGKLEAQNAELRQSERTLAQQRDKANENLARVTAMNSELRRALEEVEDFAPSCSRGHHGDECMNAAAHERALRALASDGSTVPECAKCSELRVTLGDLVTHADMPEMEPTTSERYKAAKEAFERADHILASDGSAAE